MPAHDREASTAPDAPSPDAGAVHDRLLPLPVLAERARLMTRDGILRREDLDALVQANALLEDAREQARRLLEQGRADVQALRRAAEAEAREWLQRRERELVVHMALRQAQWLEQLRPQWMQALARALRRLCSTQLRQEVLGGALQCAALEFEALAGVGLWVHPDDLAAMQAAVHDTWHPGVPVKVNVDPDLAPGCCRVRGERIELTFDIDDAIQAALAQDGTETSGATHG